MPAYDGQWSRDLVRAIRALDTYRGLSIGIEPMVGTLCMEHPVRSTMPNFPNSGAVYVYATPNWEEEDILAVLITLNDHGEWSRWFCIDVKWTGDVAEDVKLWKATLDAYWDQYIQPFLDEALSHHAENFAGLDHEEVKFTAIPVTEPEPPPQIDRMELLFATG